MTPWLNLAIVAIDLILLAALVLFLHRLSPRYGLAPLLVLLAATVTILHTLGPTGVYVRASDHLVFIIGSVVLVPASILGILLIYLVQGTAAARVTIFGILGVSILALGLHLIQLGHMGLPGGGNLAGLPSDSPALSRSPLITLASLLAFAASLSVVPVVYQTVSNHVPRTPEWLTVALALLSALMADAIVFRVTAFGWHGFVTDLPQQLGAKALAVAVMWPMVGWYVSRVVPGMPRRADARDRSALDLLFGTYGRQAEMLSLVQEARRSTEDALRQAESRLATVMANAPIVFFALDADGVILLSEGKGLESLGFAPGQLVGRPCVEAFPQAAPFVERALAGEHLTSTVELGEQVWEVTYAPIIAADGSVQGVTGLASDLTERVRAEQALRESERRFRSTFEQAAVGIAHADLSGQFLRVNARLAEMLGYTQEELMARDFAGVTHPDDMASCQALWDQALAGRHDEFSCETRYLTSRGRVVWATTTVALLRDDDGAPRYFVAVVEDITDRLATEEQLRQAQKMEVVGQLTGGVAHDFNNLMTVIMGGLELAREEVVDRPAALSALDSALEATRRGASLTQRLLAFSRKQNLRPTTVDPREMLLEMRELLATSLGETVRLEIAVDHGLWSLVADRPQMENAILNLVLNARDAMTQGGTLRIAASNATLNAERAISLGVDPGDFVLLEVLDTGIGMSPETLQHAFEPFFTTKDVGKGSGLGLSMVYGFVNQSGGHVRLESEPGGGTRVQLLMPRSMGGPRSAGPHGPDSAEPVGNKEMILVVEDDPEVRRLVVRLLARLGYRSLEAPDAPTALSLIAERPDIDLLFTDIVLPGGMTGAALAQEAAKYRADLPVVFTSGYSRDALSNDGRLSAGVDLVEKPFEKSQLALVLNEVLARG